MPFPLTLLLALMQKFAVADLQAVNRNNTPWVVVGFHRCALQRQAHTSFWFLVLHLQGLPIPYSWPSVGPKIWLQFEVGAVPFLQ